MADNVAITAGTGTTIAADDIGGNVLAQRVKPVWGPDGTGTDIDVGTAMPTQSGYAELTGSSTVANTDAIAATDVRGYRWCSLQVTSAGSGATIKLQGSNDNTTWFDYTMSPINTTTVAPVISVSAVGLWVTPIHTRYIRVRPTALTSGTVTVFAELLALPGSLPLLPTPANTANGTSGTGVAGVGVLGYDTGASVWRRMQADQNGILLTRPQFVNTASNSLVSAAITSTTLAASNTARRGLMVYNDTTGTNNLFILLGSGAATNAYTVKLVPGGYWELPIFDTAIYAGVVTGIWNTATGSAQVTEL